MKSFAAQGRDVLHIGADDRHDAALACTVAQLADVFGYVVGDAEPVELLVGARACYERWREESPIMHTSNGG